MGYLYWVSPPLRPCNANGLAKPLLYPFTRPKALLEAGRAVAIPQVAISQVASMQAMPEAAM